jgi:hypothetical protein
VPIQDGQGSTLGLVNSSNVLQTSFTYDPFGNPTAGGSATSYPFLFKGMEYDATGYYYGGRIYYSPALGRPLQQVDPGSGGGGGGGFNATVPSAQGSGGGLSAGTATVEAEGAVAAGAAAGAATAVFGVGSSDMLIGSFLGLAPTGVGLVVAAVVAAVWVKGSDNGPQFPVATKFTPDERTAVQSLLATLGVTPVQVGGVSIYRVPLDKLGAYANANPGDLERRIVAFQLDMLICAGAKYLSSGRRPSDLNPAEVQHVGLLPPFWATGVGARDPRAKIQNGLVLATVNNGDILVGVIGRRETIDSLADTHREFAKDVEVSSLMPIAIWAESSRSILLLQYDRAGLYRAAGTLINQCQDLKKLSHLIPPAAAVTESEN